MAATGQTRPGDARYRARAQGRSNVARRSRALLLLVTFAALTLAGCAGRPAGVDGSLTNNWPPMPEPSLAVPTVPACYYLGPDSDPTTVSKWPAPIACAGAAPHNFETFLLGQFTGEAAQGAIPPPEGGLVYRAAYAECDRAAREFLGDDWRTSWLNIILILPTAAHWQAGARWYRCDVAEQTRIRPFSLASRSASAKGVLAGPSDLRYGCFRDIDPSDEADLSPIACTEGHNVEFVGVVDLPDGPDVEGSGQDAAAEKACLPAIAAYVGLPNDNDMKYRTGWVYGGFGSEEWTRGNRGLRCFLWTDKQVLTKSMKGAGTKAFPVR
jgi:hypothetical protein